MHKAQAVAQSDKCVAACCFDLQKVLESPHGEKSSFYYARKLGVYNLSIYDMGTANGLCFMWPEHVANEIGTCVFKYISEKASQGVKKINAHLFRERTYTEH